jgi:cell division protease FtsH
MSENDKGPDSKWAKWKKPLLLAILVVALSYSYMNRQSNTEATAYGTDTEQVQKTNKPAGPPTYDQFIKDVAAGKVSVVTMNENAIGGITVILKDGKPYKVYSPGDPKLTDQLLASGVKINVIPPEAPSLLNVGNIIMLAFVLLIAYSIFGRKGMMGGGAAGQAGKFTETKAKQYAAGEITTRFADVAGCEEAVADVAEVVDFLHNPGPYEALGAKMPRGVLLKGSPGCGKTLLAEAVAGEANVPFFSMSGSEIVEMFVGVGSARVQDTFAKAEAAAPSIIFIDEIDAIGRSRSSGHNGQTNDEREGALNEILTKMSGFGTKGVPVIVLAATNRDDILDSALIRAGRFDRHVTMGLPDLKGREKILDVHTNHAKPRRPLEKGTNLLEIVRGMPGVSGADLANLANEAALIAVRRGAKEITANDFEMAKDKVTLGPKSGKKMNAKDKRIAAYHEAGHAIVGILMPGYDPCKKVTILPRANALGLTQFVPPEDKFSMSKKELFATLRMAYGGRAAEEIINGADEITTGASNDIERITSYLSAGVMQWGFSDKLKQLAYASTYGDHLAQSIQQLPYSQQTAQMIDQEKMDWSDMLYNDAKEILLANMDKLHAMANALLKWETIEPEQIEAIMEGREPPAPKWFVEPVAVATPTEPTTDTEQK